MKNKLVQLAERACIYSENNIIYKVNNEFIKLIGYEPNDIVGQSIMELSILLKTEIQMPIQDIEGKHGLYIFRKDDLPIEVEISCDKSMKEDNRIYYFEKKTDQFLECILCNFDNINVHEDESMAIFSYPDCILLKHNKSYIHTLSLMNIVSNNQIGKQPAFSSKVLNLLKQGIPFRESDVKITNLNGAVTYWDINVKTMCGDKNKKYLITSFFDVTKKVTERNLIEKQNRQMTLILDNMTDTINIVNNEGEYIYINKIGRKKLSPYISEEATVCSEMTYNSFCFNDINGNKLSFEDTPEQRVLRGERIRKYIIIGTSHLPTTYHECNGIPIYDEMGNIESGMLIYRDIENDYKVEEYTALKENVKDISIYYTSLSPMDFKINYMNEYSIDLIKKKRPDINSLLDIIGKNFFDYYKTKDGDLINSINKSIENHSSYLHKYEFNKNGEASYTKSVFQPMYNKNNEVEKIIAIGIDISDEEIANKQMEKMLKAQEEIFINTSHELKTPLNLIFSASQLSKVLLQKDCIGIIKEKVIYNNQIIIDNCYRLTKLINNILDIARIESGNHELNLLNYNIVDLVDDIVLSVSDYIKFKELKIIFDTEVDELIIALDIYKFERILLNLISNAIKFSNNIGVIFIKLEEKDNTVEISVKDDGIGIDKMDFDVIFKKFMQLNKSLNRLSEGTGIGLPLVKSMVELHGGSINVSSTLGKGSTFTIELPKRTVDHVIIKQNKQNYNDRVEMIRFELSDIY